MQDCFLCEKQKNLSEYTGQVIAELGGLIVTHFPVVGEERGTRGHLIIEPRRHICSLDEMNDAEAAALGVLARNCTRVVSQILKTEHIYMFRINDKVKHLHIHLVPRYPNTPKEYWSVKLMEWPSADRIGLEETKSLSKLLASAL